MIRGDEMSGTQLLSVMGTEVSALADKFGIEKSKAFLIWFAKLGFDLSDEDGYEGALVDGPNDKSIDLFYVDDFANRVVVVQGKHSETGISKPRDAAVDSLLSCLDWLSQPEVLESSGKSELAEAARSYLEAMEKDYSVELWFVYCGSKNENIDQRIRLYNDNPENQEKRRSCKHCDIGVLDTLFQEYRGEGRRIEQATVSITPNPIQVSGGFGRGLVSTIKGEELVTLYSNFGDELFARNVRLWLGAKKGSVNAGILETLEDSTESGNFWAYNNGVTMICDSFELREETQELVLRNFSIVNGCQTTVSLHQQASKVTDDVSVLLKVIGPPEQTIDSIIRYTNSQNQIRVWDISSQDPIQRRLQRDFASLEEPVYYQLRRGEQAALSTQERRKYRSNGKMRTIAPDTLAQYIGAYKLDRPVTAYKDKSVLFTKFSQDIFPPNLKASEALFIWKAGETVQEIVREEMKHDTEKGNMHSVFILKRGGRLFSLAVFSHIARFRNGTDYLRTITEERISSNKADQRLEKYAKLATLWYKNAVENLIERTNKDLSVLVREQDFWKMVKKEVDRLYRAAAVNEDWLKGALPKLF